MKLPALDPMLVQSVDKPFDDYDWVFEPKLDGMRLLCYIEDGHVRLMSRRGVDNAASHPWLTDELRNLDCTSAIIDGELVALDECGRPNFQLLQNRANNGVPLVFYAFDLLWFNDQRLYLMGLRQRRAMLERLFTGLPLESRLRLTMQLPAQGTAFYDVAVNKMGLEGIIAKRRDSRYEPGHRSDSWLKIKPVKRDEFVIGGFTAGTGGRSSTFGSLVLGYYQPGSDKLHHVGRVGTGFDEKELRKLLPMLTERVTDTSPFDNLEPRPSAGPRSPGPIQWVRPELVAEIGYDLVSNDGVLRFPRYFGLRDDVAPTEAGFSTNK